MQYILVGFIHDVGSRVFAFEGSQSTACERPTALGPISLSYGNMACDLRAA